jgi:hypothetical protein
MAAATSVRRCDQNARHASLMLIRFP